MPFVSEKPLVSQTAIHKEGYSKQKRLKQCRRIPLRNKLLQELEKAGKRMLSQESGRTKQIDLFGIF